MYLLGLIQLLSNLMAIEVVYNIHLETAVPETKLLIFSC